VGGTCFECHTRGIEAMSHQSRRRDKFTEKAMSSVLVSAVRKAMAEHGINATVGTIEHHIRTKQILTGFRYDDIRECARQQRIMASDWLFPSQNGNIPRPEPIIPPSVAERFTEPPKPDEKPPAPPTILPITPKIPEASNVVRIVSPPVVAPEAEPEAKKDDKRNQLDQATRYRVTQWIDTQRDFIARQRWHMGDLLAALTKEFPKIVLTESNVHSFLKVINLKLHSRPQPATNQPERISKLHQRLNQLEEALTAAHLKITELTERVGTLETKLAPLLTE